MKKLPTAVGGVWLTAALTGSGIAQPAPDLSHLDPPYNPNVYDPRRFTDSGQPRLQRFPDGSIGLSLDQLDELQRGLQQENFYNYRSDQFTNCLWNPNVTIEYCAKRYRR